MVAGDSAILIHIERHDVFERHFAGFVELDELAVHAEGRAAGGATEHERMFGRRFGLIDAGGDIAGSPLRYFFVVGFDDQSPNLKVF